MTGSDDGGIRFSLVVGGPFHEGLRRLGLVGEDLLLTPGAAVGLALFVWLPLALLMVTQSILDDSYVAWGFFTD